MAKCKALTGLAVKGLMTLCDRDIRGATLHQKVVVTGWGHMASAWSVSPGSRGRAPGGGQEAKLFGWECNCGLGGN